MASDPLRILFVCGSDFDAAAEKQALWLARELSGRGHRVMMSLQGNRTTATSEGADRIAGVHLHWHGFRGRAARGRDVDAASGFAPDLIHARTSRLPTLAATRSYANATGAAVFVHWMDDEWGAAPRPPLRAAPGQRARLAARHSLSALNPRFWHFSTPWSLEWATRHALAFDALTPALAEEVRRRTGRECAVIP
ncbi:MAG: hypothetical protein ACR2G3_13050, partial [Solirubrobacterales bacterium]